MRWILTAFIATLAAASASAAEPSPVPEWLKPGARVSYFQGSATIASDGQILVQDDKGNWVNVAGQKFAVKDNPGTGGGGFTQLTIVAADARVVAAEMRTFVLIDPKGGRVSFASVGALVGTPAALSDYWLSPASLAARPDSNEGGLSVHRMPYPLGGRTYNAIVVEMRSGTSYQRSTYDLETGLLLAASTSAVGAGGFVPNPNGTSSMKAGGSLITSTVLAGVRQLKLPWGDDARPEAIVRGARFDYRGTYSTVVAGSPPVSQAITTNLTFGEPGAQWAQARFGVALASLLGGPPQTSVSDRVLGSWMTMPGWLQPKTIARLAPGTVVDEDPVTRFRTTYLGVRGDSAVVVEEGPFDRVEAAFDVRSGVLAAANNVQQNGLGQTQVRVERVRGR